MSSILKGIVEAVGDGIMAILIWQTKRGAAQLTRWFDATTPATLMADLDKKLEPVLKKKKSHIDETFRKFSHAGKGAPVWTFESFKRLTEHHDIFRQENTIRLLWQIFAYAAHYPFSLSGSRPITDITIDLVAFRRAYALLVLHAFDLVLETGKDRELHAEYGFMQSLPDEKTPRIARNIHEATAIRSQQVSDSDVDIDEAANIRDVLYHVQPTIYQWMTMKATDFRPWFEKTAARLVDQQASPALDDKKTASRSMRRSDFHALLKALLLLRPRKELWEEGHSTESKSLDLKFQHAGDTHYARLDDSAQAIALASTHATTLVDSAFSDGNDFISMEAFRAWCIENKSYGTSERTWGPWGPWDGRSTHARSFFIYTFYQLWSAIFVAAPPSERSAPALPTPTSNVFQFARATHSLSFHAGSNWRWHSDEHELQLDLQHATLVAESTGDSLNSKLLHKALTNKKNFFHIVLLQSSNSNTHDHEKSDHSNSKTTMAAFVSGFADPPSRTEMCSLDMQNCYVWRTSLIQLEAQLKTWNCGGLSARLDDGSLRLSSQGRLVGQGVELRLDSEEGEMIIDTPEVCEEVTGEGASDGEVYEGPATMTTKQRRLDVSAVQCYRLPRAAACFTSSHPPVMPWTE